MGVAPRVTIAVLWAIALVMLSTWSNTDGAVVAALSVTLLAAALIDSWWLLLVPVPPALLLIAGSLASGSEVDSDGFSGWDWAGVVAVACSGLVLLLDVGVALGRGGRVLRRRWRT